MLKPRAVPSVIEANEQFYMRHKAEIDHTAASLRLSGIAFLCLAAAGLLHQAWKAGGGFFLPTSNVDQLAFGCFLLHAETKLNNLIKGQTMREAADEVCAALAAVGDCLSLFGWVVGFEAVSELLTLCAEYFGYKYDELLSAAAYASLRRVVEWEQQHQFIMLLMLQLLGLWAWPSLRKYLAERVNWLALAIREEAHDVRIQRELKRFEKHCGPQEGLTPEDLLQRDELAHILADIGYDPEPGQLDALLGAAVAQQLVGALSLHWLLEEIEALLGRTDAPSIRQRIMRQQQRSKDRKNKEKLRKQTAKQTARAAATPAAARSPSPLPSAAALGRGHSRSVSRATRSPSPSPPPADTQGRRRRSVRLSGRQGGVGDAQPPQTKRGSDWNDGTSALGIGTRASIAAAGAGTDTGMGLDDADNEPPEPIGVAAAAATMATLLPVASPELPPVAAVGSSVVAVAPAGALEFSPRRTRSSVRRR